MSPLRQFSPFTFLVALLGASGAFGADYSFQPIGASGGHTIEGNRIILDSAGQTVTLELRVDNWDPVPDVGVCGDLTLCSVSAQDCDYGACLASNGLLSVYQARIDGSGYEGILTPVLLPPDQMIDVNRPDYVFYGVTSIAVVDSSTINWAYGALTLWVSDSQPYVGVDKYGGTLVIDVPVDAVGDFTIDLMDDPNETFLQDSAAITIVPVNSIPAQIVFACDTAADCDDGNGCTTDTCEAGVCAYGAAAAGTPCGDPSDTTCTAPDTCDGAGVCLPHHAPDGTDCSDVLFCNGVELCAGGICEAGSDPCPASVCDEAGDTCVACLTDADCDDGLFCNGTETCTDAGCQAGTPVDCDDGVDCTDDACNEGNDACEHTANDGLCDDNNDCTEDTCTHGICVNTPLPAGSACGDPTDDACTAPDTCDGAGNCLANHEPNDTPCEDDLFCNGPDACQMGVCEHGPDPCPDSACDEDANACVECLTDADCVDGDPCTDDACEAGLCVNPPASDGTPCEDDLFCNGAEACVSGVCEPGTDPCPDSMCDEDTDACAECLSDADCDDGSGCTADTCVAGACGHLATCLYVDDNVVGAGDGSTWCDAFNHLQDALSAARAPGSVVTAIYVAQGLYKPDQGIDVTPGDRLATFELINGVPLSGGYAGCGAADPGLRDPALYETILSGDLLGDDGPDFANYDENSYHVVSGLTSNAEYSIDGFTITAGNADGSVYLGNLGGGVYLSSHTSISIRACRIRSNWAGAGAGLFGEEHSSANAVDTVFLGNRSGGRGGAAALDAYASFEARDCRFLSNTAVAAEVGKGGAVSLFLSSCRTDNCVFHANTAASGGAIHAYSSCTIVATNTTFSANTGGGSTSTLQTIWGSGSVEMANCIIRDGEDSIAIDDDTTVMITYSNVQGGWPGVGNIDADPLFVPGPDGCFYLSQVAAGQPLDSPCLDAGSAPAVDLGLDTMTTRTDEVTDAGIVDMGYHYPVTGSTVPVTDCPGCFVDADCDDGLFCNTDHCDFGVCMHKGDPCAGSGLLCDEDTDACVECLDGTDCDDAIDCTDDICTAGECANIYVPAQPPLVATDPPDGAIDGRQPFELDGTDPAGWQSIVWSFAEPVASLDVGQFVVTEIGGDGVPPSVVAAESTDNLTYTLTLSEPIEVLAWTDVLYPPGCQHMRIGYLPGDVNADGVSDPPDILAVIDAINEVTPRPLHSADVDRNGVIEPSDILRVIDLLNGAGAYPSFYGAELP